MAIYLSKRELEQTEPADVAAFRSPVPTQVISNGEFNPIPQTRQQRQVEARIKELADTTARKLGLSRRRFLRTGSGMAAAFLAMNDVYGRFFEVSAAEAAEPTAAAERAQALANQYIVDVQTHFVRDDYKGEFMLGILKYAADNYNPALKTGPGGLTLDAYKFDNYLKEIWFDSDTKVALLSGAPFDDPAAWFLNNDQIHWAHQAVNKVAGSNRLLYHSLVTPKQPGWTEEVDRCIGEIKPSSWKSYTIGDPLNPKTTKWPWRLDDEKLVYPWYEKAVKAGITTVCCHVRTSLASRTRRRRSALVNVGCFTCRWRMISWCRKRAISAISSDLLRPRSVRVASGNEVPSGLVQRAKRDESACKQPYESCWRTVITRSIAEASPSREIVVDPA